MHSRTAAERPLRAWSHAAVTLGTLFVVGFIHSILSRIPAYGVLHRQHPFYVAESIDKIGGTLLCLLVVWILRRKGLHGLLEEIGLTGSPLPAIGFALMASAPLWIGFAATRKPAPGLDLFAVLFLGLLSPCVEEIEFRGFGVRFLQRGTGWPFWVAVWPQVVLFGLGHVERGQTFAEIAGLFLLTGTGGLLFAWLLHRWRSLWFPVALHAVMNLSWEVFSIADSGLGGWFPFALQVATILLAIGITLRRTERRTSA